MNDQLIEQILRQAPAPQPPPGLKEQLKTGIRLPAPPSEWIATATPLWRRWFPALSFGFLFLGSLVALAVQTNQLLELRRENSALRSAAAIVEELRRENAELQSLHASAVDRASMDKEHNELLKLRGEVRQLRMAAQEMPRLRAENQRLQAIAAAATHAPAFAHGATLSSAPSIRFSETNWDFGQVISTEPQTHVFVVANDGNAPLEIHDVIASCGCTATGQWDRRVEPGKTGMIPIMFNPSKFNGAFRKSVVVTSNDPETPVMTLLIQAEICRPSDAQP